MSRLKKNEFDRTHDDIKIEKISRFLEQQGPHFEFGSRSFNYSMPKEEAVGLQVKEIMSNQLI